MFFFAADKEKRLNIKEGDRVIYNHDGKDYEGRVDAILWLGSMKARIIPAVKGHPTTLPVRELKLIRE